jgi:hypothetical protein
MGESKLKFQDLIKSHMSDFRINQLGVSEMGCWKKNNQQYPHILPEEKYELNLLTNYREGLSDYILTKNIHLHKDFHHLNSSQAVCLNFFYPMIADNQINLLLELLHLENEVVERCEFEKIIPNADGTNFDFYIQLQSGKHIFFEIKYTEDGFGKVTDNLKYQQKYDGVYRNRLAGKIRAGVPEYQTLIDNYQLLRNISYVDASRDDLLIIICPRENLKLHREYDYVINNIIEPRLHDKIRMITWETLLFGLRDNLKFASNVPNRFVEHYGMFEEKYNV